MDHANADGQQVHGPEAESSQSRRNVAPHLSDFVKQLVLSLATLGLTATQILADLQGKKQAEQLTGRDAEIKDQDIRNIMQQLDQQTWRCHPDVAASLRAWVWMYQEHMSSAPVFDSAQPLLPSRTQQAHFEIRVICSQQSKVSGFTRNRKKEQLLTNAVIAADNSR
ncbi:hypothetical protein ABBQ38_012268 [Trebouxia sp. C0009 RCD-2024]